MQIVFFCSNKIDWRNCKSTPDLNNGSQTVWNFVYIRKILKFCLYSVIIIDSSIMQSLSEFLLCIWSKCILLWMVVYYIKTIMAKLCIFTLNNLMKNFRSLSDDKKVNYIHASHAACWNFGNPMLRYEHYILRLPFNLIAFHEQIVIELQNFVILLW